MKINYKNTALAFLKDPMKFGFNIPDNYTFKNQKDEIAFGHSVQRAFQSMAPKCAENIRYITVPFIKAYLQARPKLKDVFDKEEFNEAGTFVWTVPPFTHTTFYYLKTTGTGKDWDYHMMFTQFSKHSKNDHISLDVMVTETDNKVKEFIWKGHVDNGASPGYYASFLITLLCFLRYAELETKIVNAKRRDYVKGVKYLNETDFKVDILDSTYFTEIVRTEGFKVRGHFRLQPWGPGLTQRKLKWIADFEKEGYHRRAKIQLPGDEK